MKIGSICILLSLGAGLPKTRAEWQPLELFRERFIGSNFFTVFMPQNATQWVRVEVSGDLKTWAERANVLTTRQSHLFGDIGAISAPRQFYRTCVPGTTLAEAKLRWQSSGVTAYRFVFRIWPSHGGPLVGTITSSGGNKIVSDVRDLDTMEPAAEYDPDDFPDINQLFDAIAETTSPGKSVDCEVIYDPQRSFPVRTAFTIGDIQWRIYEISDFEALPVERPN